MVPATLIRPPAAEAAFAVTVARPCASTASAPIPCNETCRKGAASRPSLSVTRPDSDCSDSGPPCADRTAAAR